MIRNYLKFIGIFTLLSSNCFAAEGGMPQLNPDYWVSQVFWGNADFRNTICNLMENNFAKN